jgi:hypothetical protein
MKWLQIQELLFGCAWNLLLESKSAPNSKSCLDVQTMEFNVLLSLDDINLRICKKNSMCLLECIYIIFPDIIIKHLKNRLGTTSNEYTKECLAVQAGKKQIQRFAPKRMIDVLCLAR